MATTQATGAITLKGSAQIVSEFFGYGINSILYQRGVYDETLFSKEHKYDLPLMVVKDKELKEYISKVAAQIEVWLEQHAIDKVVLVIMEIESDEVLERWQFDIDCDTTAEQAPDKAPSKKQVQEGIRNLMRQIVSCVTFLPVLETPCCFDILFFLGNSEIAQPSTMSQTDAHLITNAQEVSLRSFSTGHHAVRGQISYKYVS